MNFNLTLTVFNFKVYNSFIRGIASIESLIASEPFQTHQEELQSLVGDEQFHQVSYETQVQRIQVYSQAC